MTSRLFLVAVVTALFASACGHDVGDSCKTAADCDPNGTRVCDLSQPGGYCTQVGCDDKSCPSGSVCIRYFPAKLLQGAQSCDPICEGLGNALSPPAGCSGHVDTCAADELCLDSRVCARRSYETRSCAYTCGGDGDCRGGYACRQTEMIMTMPVDASTDGPADASPSVGMMLLGQTASAMAKVCTPR